MIEKIKEIIENSESFVILLDKNPEEHELLAREVLKETINSKKTPLLTLQEYPEDLKEKWLAFIKPEIPVDFPQKTSIKIPKEKYGIKEVGYKEEDEHLSLIVTSSGNILPQDLALEKLPPEVDAAFCLFENKERLEDFKDQIQLPENEKIIFITPNKRTITEKIVDIIKIFDDNIITNNKNINSLLLASLLTETNNFTERMSKEILSLGAFLMENETQKEAIFETLEKEKTLFKIQLLGRLLARTYLDEVLGISWSFLNNRDFQKTSSPHDSSVFLYNLLKKSRSFIKPQNLHILLWQTIEGVKALISLGKKQELGYLIPLAQKMNSRLESSFFVVGPFDNFSQAEIHLREVLKNQTIS